MTASQSPAIATLGTAPSRNALLVRRTLFVLLGLLGAISLLMVAVVLSIAWQLNRETSAHSQRLVDKLWQATEQRLTTTTRDNANWGDAYSALHLRTDLDWAFTRDNLGPSLFNHFGFEGIFVIGPGNRTTYAVEQGQLSDASLQAWLKVFPEDLIREAREADDEDDVALRIVERYGQPVLLSAARLGPGNRVDLEGTAGEQSVLVLAYLLNPGKLRALGDSYEIDQLRAAIDSTDTTAEPQLRITPQWVLRWNPEQPGNRLLKVLLPTLLVSLVVLLFMAVRIARRTLNNARLLDHQYTVIQASRTALGDSEARFRNLAEAASDWFWETDLELRLLYLSERFETITGQPAQAWLGQRLDHLLHSLEQPLGTWIANQHTGGPRAVLRCTHVTLHGDTLTSLLAARPVLNAGQVVGYQGSASDITREVAAEARLRQLSEHDALTGLANRSRLREALQTRLERLTGEAESLALLTLDLDHFKPVNDLYGHSGGDQVLREVALRLTRCQPEGALLARQGGDEFVMLFDTVPDQAATEALCQRLISAIDQPFVVSGQEVVIGLSIGIACAPTHGTVAEDLLRFSDLALYQAKKGGRNTWRFYEPAMTQLMERQRELEKHLRKALQHGQFSLRYQPRYDIRSGRISGAEALIRWEHPQLGLCMPDQFIGLAEEKGLIVPLSDWVLLRACTDALQWPGELRVSVNISAVEFRTAGLVERIRSVLAATGLPAARLELELTERVVIDDAPSSLELMLALKALGVRLSMDDFGTGYSSLSYLKDYPFDTLKIDRSFINEIDRSAQGRCIVQAIIDLGRALSLSVTAEGVETEQQLQQLAAFACDEAQGYFLNRPMPLAALLEAIARQNDSAYQPH